MRNFPLAFAATPRLLAAVVLCRRRNALAVHAGVASGALIDTLAVNARMAARAVAVVAAFRDRRRRRRLRADLSVAVNLFVLFYFQRSCVFHQAWRYALAFVVAVGYGAAICRVLFAARPEQRRLDTPQALLRWARLLAFFKGGIGSVFVDLAGLAVFAACNARPLVATPASWAVIVIASNCSH